MAFYVYILYSKQLDLYYIGSSGNVDERLKKHLAKHKGFTARAKDWIICYTNAFETKAEALKFEKQLKGWKSRKKIQQLVAGQ